MKLEEDLAERKAGSEKEAKANERKASVLSICALVASAAATITAVLDSPRELTAVLAALPGIIALTFSTLRFDARSQWWWAKYIKFDALLRALRDEGKSDKEVSREMTVFLDAHNVKYPGPGKAPA